MYKLEDIRSVHLELTTKCQARCPMCPRRINGGLLNPLFELCEIDLETFKEWFPESFIKQLDSLFMCGNLGDPIIAQDCIEIFSYIRETNPNIFLRMHTNGSARNSEFWEELARLNVRTTFGIDGLEDTHKLYRVDTDFNKIIENATTFINNGGIAEWHMLVFKHNQHQTGACQHMADMLGFKKFYIKHTSRFMEQKFHALDESGRTTHILYPTHKSEDMTIKVKEALNTHKPYINCKAKRQHEIYISANGNVGPCCWLDLDWQLPKQENRIDYMDRISEFPNLKHKSLVEIFESSYFNKIQNTWDNNPLIECSRQCGQFDKLNEQFV